MIYDFYCIQFYNVPVYEENSDKSLSENQLIEQLLLIIRRNETADVPVGILTSEHRDVLAPAYEKLVKGIFHYIINDVLYSRSIHKL